MITVGKAAKMFGLSRTALLYYDSLGLVKAKRAANGYRLYSGENIERLSRVISLRDAGVPLGEISEYLETPGSDICSILLKRLGGINRQIETARKQQEVIIKLLKNAGVREKRKFRTDEWMETLRQAGVEEGKSLQWHFLFEKQSPGQHRELLLALGFSDEEIKHFKKIYEDSVCRHRK
jgi:DNA-binding transcriptional MerR regulator